MNSQEHSRIQFDKNVEAIMRDGAVLRANVVRPAEPGRYPAMLIRHPYGKDSELAFLAGTLVKAARLGFVAIEQDCRNRFASGGGAEYEPFRGDMEDGEDSVAWAAALPFCDGRVVMSGASYFGLTQWAAAVRAPAALKAIAPFESIGHPYRGLMFTGGALELNMLHWQTMMALGELQRQVNPDPDVLAAINKELGDAAKLFAQLPIGSDAKGLHGTGLGAKFNQYLARDRAAPPPDLAEVIASQQFEEITVPAYVLGGWYDCFATASIDQFTGMRDRAGSQVARDATRLIMGPWAHAQFGSSLAERFFGGASARVTDFIDAGQFAWYRAVLDSQAAPSPPVQIFIMGANVWRDEQAWPLARAVETSWYLSSAGRANSRDGDGVLSLSPIASPPDTYLYDPADPVPTWGGSSLNPAYLPGPRDQARVESRADVLVYTSAPLVDEIEITGTPIVELWASSDAEDTDFVARLVDVAPDGTAFNLCDGIARARYRDNHLAVGPGEPIVRLRPYMYRIELGPTSNLFKKGHKLRVDITSSSFPRWSRNLNIFDDRSATLNEAKIASQQIFHDGARASRILLPIIPTA